MSDVSPDAQEQQPGWLYRQRGKALGPISTKEIRQLAETGKLRPADLIRPENGDQWIEARSISDLFPEEILEAETLKIAQRKGPWKNNALLVVRKGYAIPKRCILTNEKPKKILNRQIHRVNKLVYLLLFIHAAFFYAVYSFTRQTILLGIPLSEEGLRRRKSGLLFAWLITSTGIIIFCASIEWFNWYGLFGGMTVFFAGLVYVSRKASVLIPQKMNDHYAWLKGACPEYLETLPEWKSGQGRRR